MAKQTKPNASNNMYQRRKAIKESDRQKVREQDSIANARQMSQMKASYGKTITKK